MKIINSPREAFDPSYLLISENGFSENIHDKINWYIKVYIKTFFINGVQRNFTPFWLDLDGNLENDPYTSDCAMDTNATNPHAYSDITIQNGQIQSKTCIKKQPGTLFM